MSVDGMKGFVVSASAFDKRTEGRTTNGHLPIPERDVMLGETKHLAGGRETLRSAQDDTAGRAKSDKCVPVIGIAIALLFLALAWLTLKDYGITWDEPENFLSGDLYFRFFLTGDRTLLNFRRLRDEWEASGNKPLFYQRIFAQQERYPPTANLVSAFAAWLLHERLGWLDPIDGHHAAIPVFGALGVLVTFLFAWQSRRRLAPAFVAALSLAMFPLYWGHAHNNIKDVPMAALFAATLWAGWRAFGQTQGIRCAWIVAAGVLWGLTLGVKPNALFIPLILLAWLMWLWIWPSFRAWREGRSWRRAVLAGFMMLALGGITLLAIWPHLWSYPLERLYRAFQYFINLGSEREVFFEGRFYVPGQSLPWRYALTHLVLTTPEVTLGLAGLGLVRAVRESWRGESDAPVLWLIWFGATLLRVSLPGTVIYNGLRQIMEVLPALALLAGLGAQWLWEWITRALASAGRQRLQPWVGALLALLLVVPQAVTLASLHPYEGAFFNILAGGMAKAGERYTLEYWGQSYKDGAAWLNQHARAGAWVAVPIADHVARFYLRPDVRLIATDRVADLAGLDGEGYVMFMRNRDCYRGLGTGDLPEYCEAHCTPAYQIRVGGTPILTIYHWPPAASS